MSYEEAYNLLGISTRSNEYAIAQIHYDYEGQDIDAEWSL